MRIVLVSVGIVLVIVGLLALLPGGLPWQTSDTVAEIGPLKIEEKDRIRVPPVLGAAGIVAGAGLLIAGAFLGKGGGSSD